ncbi:MAG: hypothetical protein HZB82_09530 [Deltaproteobacteria bacterium]|nr:hypothetical protein [Deltaproteobacteria bacterium]
MKYQVVGSLKVRTMSGVRQLKSGDFISLPDDMALRLIKGGRVKPFSPDCFSQNGTLEAAFTEAKADGWTDDRLCDYIDALRKAQALKAPWGFKVKDSPLIEDYWIISESAARDRLPAGAKAFTIEELRPIVEAFRVFPCSRIIKVQI